VAELDHNGLQLVYLQRGPEILLRSLDLFISALFGILFVNFLLRFCPTRPSPACWRRQDVSGPAASGVIYFPRTESSKFCVASISSPNWK